MEDNETVVTMVDVLQQQQEFEEDADAVLGACDDKNCTYNKGYVKRQALYACLTCCSESKTDPTKRAAVCLACSLNCHENHTLVELYTKRNFRCDCGNKKFNTPCQLTPDKDDINEDNIYNQNFVGLYCVCSRPYPDPDVPEEEEEDMIQCIICEDWLHASHLEANVPSNDQYAEMICQNCMDKNEFIYDYTNYAVNTLDCSIVDVTTIENITDNDSNAEKMNITNNENENESVDHEMDTDKTDFKDIEPKVNDINKENIDISNEVQCKDGEVNITSSDSAEKVEISDKNVNDNSERVESTNQQEEDKMETDVKEKENIDKPINGIGENPAESQSNESEITEQSKNKHDSNGGDKMIELFNKNGEASDGNVDKNRDEVDDNDKGAKTSTIKEKSAIENITKDQSSILIVNKDNNENHKSSENVAEALSDDVNFEESQNNVINSEGVVQSQHQENSSGNEHMKEVNEENTNKTKNDVHDNDETSIIHENSVNENILKNQSSILNEAVNEEIKIHLQTNADADVETSDNKDVPENNTDEVNTSSGREDQSKTIETASDSKNLLPAEIEMTESNQQNELDEKVDNGCSNENKRKLCSEDDSVENPKKLKLDFGNCQRLRVCTPRTPGATFWPSNFRQKLCTCSKCIEMYKDLSVLFLTDLEDTVSAYEAMGKENSNGVPVSQYEKGLQALSSLDRVQQINALTEYNNMRDKLVDFLKNFKDRKEVVKEEDIKEFFAGMKAKKEPDGVYFCR